MALILIIIGFFAFAGFLLYEVALSGEFIVTCRNCRQYESLENRLSEIGLTLATLNDFFANLVYTLSNQITLFQNQEINLAIILFFILLGILVFGYLLARLIFLFFKD